MSREPSEAMERNAREALARWLLRAQLAYQEARADRVPGNGAELERTRRELEEAEAAVLAALSGHVLSE